MVIKSKIDIDMAPIRLVCQTNERPFAFDSLIIYDGLLLEPYSTAVSAFISRHKWTPRLISSCLLIKVKCKQTIEQ